MNRCSYQDGPRKSSVAKLERCRAIRWRSDWISLTQLLAGRAWKGRHSEKDRVFTISKPSESLLDGHEPYNGDQQESAGKRKGQVIPKLL